METIEQYFLVVLSTMESTLFFNIFQFEKKNDIQSLLAKLETKSTKPEELCYIQSRTND